MTGSDDNPPGKVAENWSRRDHIRAGAVSGPWRSGPRATPERPAATPVRETASPLSNPAPKPHVPWMERRSDPAASTDDPHPAQGVETATGQTHRTHRAVRDPDLDDDPAADPVAQEIRAPDATARPARRRGIGLGAAVASGSLVAIALVAAALLLRPVADRDISAPAPAVAEPDSAAANPAPMPAFAASDSAILRLRVGPAFPQDRQTEILGVLADAGHAEVLVERIPFDIAVSRVGYYRPEDREAAVELARLMTPVLDEPTGPVAVRDYAELLPDAAPGRLDLWIGK